MKHTLFLKYIISFCLMVIAISARASLPKSIDGKLFLFQAANLQNEDNPNANQIFIMHYGKDTYTYEVAGKQKIIKGNYTYKVLDQNNEIGLISCHEIDDDKKTDYTLLLNAENDKAGLYIYRQTNGSISPQKRLNFAYYTILENF